MTDDRIAVGLLLFPEMTQLDMTGPYEVFASMPRTTVEMVWKTLEPVPTGGGLRMLPTTTIAACPRLDVICVPGGPGQVALMQDAEVLDFPASAGRDLPLRDLGVRGIAGIWRCRIA